jgi:hypothetical protein
MTLFALICLLVGMTLGQRFKVLILLPAIALTLVVAIGVGIARADAPWAVVLAAAAAIASLQIGYLGGVGILHLAVVARASRQRAASLAGGLSARRHAH